MLLTVVVPTIPGRESLLSRCLWSITEQATDEVHVLCVQGSGRLGDKANLAALHTGAKYLTIVDDDDYLDGAYVSLVLPHLERGVDYVGFKVVQWINQRLDGIGSTSGERCGYARRGRNHGPCPKGVTSVDIWRQVPFGNSYTADRVWSEQVFPHIRSHAFVDRALYVYDHQPATSAFLGGGHRDVGVWPYDASRVEFLTLD